MLRFALVLAATLSLLAAEHRGTVTFGGLPVPGASVTAEVSGQSLTTSTDANGAYLFSNLPSAPVTVRVTMQLFAPQSREVTPGAPPLNWDLELLTQETRAVTVAAAPPAIATPKKAPAAATNTKGAFQRAEVAAAKDAPANTPAPQTDPEATQRAADGLLINGSVNNGASSPFAQLPAFGNFRRGARSMYNGSLGLILNHSAFDARSYSVTGQDTPKPAYSRAQGLFAFGGPLKIPKWLPRNGPMFTVNYQWTRNTNALTQSGLVPTARERAGDFTGAARPPVDPLNNGLPFPAAQLPSTRIAPEARALLPLFPAPNFTGSTRYNFQTPIVSGLHQDDLQTRMNKQRRKNFYSGNFNWQSTRTSDPNLHGFLDTTRSLGLNTGVNFRRYLHPRFFVNLGLQYSRANSTLAPFFAARRNISGDAGIRGNNQDPANWGPPALSFSSGISTLADAQASTTRNQTMAYSADAFFNRNGHNLTFGAVHRRQQFNVLSQQDARGSFVFTGAAAGNDTAGFLLGIPDTSSIAFGNADKYLRATINETFFNDDWRVHPGLTINYGARWEYWSPATEKYGRLVNAQGPLQPDKNNLAPRIGFSWRPLVASSLVVRGGYGVYYDTSIYQPIAMQMAQQAPLSKSIRIANSAATPLTLANGFPGGASAAVYAVDPHLRTGYSQNWQLSLQRDLPWAMQMTAAYNGGKGTRAQQQFLPNTFPTGAVEPSGFTYLTSNGNSSRHAGSAQMRRRLRSGFTGQLSYTWAKSIDNAALGGRNQGGPLIAQNWLDLRAERARSNFDQRHLLTAMAQYTAGMGLKGGALTSGWKARAFKDWTFTSQINAGSGLPLTPIYLAAVRGTGVTGSLRPDFTGASVYDAPPGLFLNPAALSTPAPGRWGNAGRNSINGPNQFALAASAGRTFRSTDRFSIDFRIDASNALNSVRFPSWNTVFGNAQFGLPTIASPMRTLQATLRTRF